MRKMWIQSVLIGILLSFGWWGCPAPKPQTENTTEVASDAADHGDHAQTKDNAATDTAAADTGTKDTASTPDAAPETAPADQATPADQPTPADTALTPDPAPQDTATTPDATADTATTPDTPVTTDQPGTTDTAPSDDASDYKWYKTCGDPSCSGWRAKSDVPLCNTQKDGNPCNAKDDKCDPKNDCNIILLCTDQDPTQQPGGCPKSRKHFKRDIRYLGTPELEHFYRELMKMRLATYRYKFAGPKGPQRLGFMIDDQPRSVAVDRKRNMVDLYGYMSMAVAALKVQSKQIAALKREVAALRKQVRTNASKQTNLPTSAK